MRNYFHIFLKRFSITIVVFLCVIFSVALLPFASHAHASTSDGTIDPVSKYAWGSSIGWLNFGTSGGDVHVTDAALTGYVWNPTYGWINLAPAGSGVTNNGEGVLSGSAWGENLGYIDFNGVSISSLGVFSGSASGTVSGAITFDCAQCSVVTDWRPASTRGGGGGVGGGGTGGGGGSAPPTLGVLINGNTSYTPSPDVTLTITRDASVVEMMISNFADFRDGVREPAVAAKPWNLCRANGAIASPCAEGVHTVFVRFYGAGGVPYGPFTDSILYSVLPPGPAAPQAPAPTSPGQQGNSSSSWFGTIGNFFNQFIPDFLKPKPKSVPEIPLEQLLPRSTPLSFRGVWELLPRDPINEFVFAALPHDFALLLEKFPDFARIVKDVGIARQADLQKLSGITLSLPGFTTASLQKSFDTLARSAPGELTKLRSVVLALPGFSPAALPNGTISGGRFAVPPGVPLANLPVQLKKNVPSEVVFARAGNEKIDLDIKLSLSDKGTLDQQINTNAGSILELVVKPEHPAAHVYGYLAFTSRTVPNQVGSSLGADIKLFLASAFLAPHVSTPGPDFRLRWMLSLASAVETFMGRPTTIGTASIADLAAAGTGSSIGSGTGNMEERLAVSQFEYTDPDHDGIYTATIQAPAVSGQYALYTIITYIDPQYGSKEIKLITVIDPEGYVYESTGGRETRIPGAVVSIYHLDSTTKQYSLWPADQYSQENPQVTDVRGSYAFLVPQGTYYVTVDAPGFDTYEGKAFDVKAGTNGVHTNIKLSSKYGLIQSLDWKTILLVVVTMLLFYNFYTDHRRRAAETMRANGTAPAGR